jgi:hypothetical protein
MNIGTADNDLKISDFFGDNPNAKMFIRIPAGNVGNKWNTNGTGNSQSDKYYWIQGVIGSSSSDYTKALQLKFNYENTSGANGRAGHKNFKQTLSASGSVWPSSFSLGTADLALTNKSFLTLVNQMFINGNAQLDFYVAIGLKNSVNIRIKKPTKLILRPSNTAYSADCT